MTYAAKPDSNKAEIVAFLRNCGRDWEDARRDAGHDGWILDYGKTHLVEIKHPETRNKLTRAERRMRVICESLGIPYNIITSIEEVRLLIGV